MTKSDEKGRDERLPLIIEAGYETHRTLRDEQKERADAYAPHRRGETHRLTLFSDQ